MKHGFEPKFSITNAVTTALTTIERAQGFIEAATLSDAWIQKMGERALVLEAHHTTHIEGTQLTLEQSERLWAGEEVPEANPDDRQEFLNYRAAFDLVSEYLNSPSPITEGLIREIHRCLVQAVRGGKAAPGDYRKIQNQVVNAFTGEIVYTPPEAYEVPRLMQEMVDWINQDHEIHPVLVSGIAQFQLVHIHPFLDGNGRTSRLLSTLCLYRAGYDFKRLFTISEYYDRDRPSFYSAVQSVRQHNMDLTGWVEYFAQGLATQMQEVRHRGEKVICMDLLTRNHNLNTRQAAVLDFLINNAHMHIRDFEGLCPDVNRRTLQRDLNRLEELTLIYKKGAARQSLYSLNEKAL